jgi:hypothetical protein
MLGVSRKQRQVVGVVPKEAVKAALENLPEVQQSNVRPVFSVRGALAQYFDGVDTARKGVSFAILPEGHNVCEFSW